ncbi:winged helix-turn-helix domain-containing protein [Serratia marcescens]|nr:MULTISPECIES: winged helix-turn-helix domain-containing protein [Serratia]AVN32291.1 transcriptional regulator [Serratia marcescens]AVN52824.1 transcriptional regulator [Serratia marcescens]AWC70015.1 transcriptional regulator [Serratia marcescens]AWC75546.1 transcriptional regulator [Serratia marcescens]AWC78998.1 transcriptional regulator [Serratia marcescens]
MKYIVNKTVVFDSNEMTLYLYENTQIVTRLTKPATRLLLTLIQNSGVNVNRDTLLENVWLTYGFTASNAGLNNYISELRKAFSSLGYKHELIITIPKLGFRFESKIDIMDPAVISSESVEEEKVSEISEDAAPKTVLVKLGDREITSFPHRKVYSVLTGITLVILCIFFLKNISNDSHAYHKIAKIDNCNVYIIGQVFQKNDVLSEVNAVLKREEVDCTSFPSDVFYLEDRIGKRTVRADLISVCSKSDNDRYNTCFNIKSQRNTSK